MSRSRLKPELRKEQILDAAMIVAERSGYLNMLRREVADEAKCGNGTVSHYFGTMTQLCRAVMRKAIEDRNLSIIAQGIAAQDRHALKAPGDIKQAAMESLLQCSTNT